MPVTTYLLNSVSFLYYIFQSSEVLQRLLLVYICELYVSYRDIANHTPKTPMFHNYLCHQLPEKCLVSAQNSPRRELFWWLLGHATWKICFGKAAEIVVKWWNATGSINTAWKKGLGKLNGFTALPYK